MATTTQCINFLTDYELKSHELLLQHCRKSSILFYQTDFEMMRCRFKHFSNILDVKLKLTDCEFDEVRNLSSASILLQLVLTPPSYLCLFAPFF